jgi:peptidoglycan/LPS O-acetylase OafA/YrhL
MSYSYYLIHGLTLNGFALVLNKIIPPITRAIFVAVLAASSALAQTSSKSDFFAIRREIEQNVAAGNVPAVSVAVAQQGKVGGLRLGGS